MLLRLEDALSDVVRWQEEMTVDGAELGRADLLALSPIRASGELRAIEGGFLLNGAIEYHQGIACARCLEPVDQDVALSFDAFLVPSQARGSAKSGSADLDEEVELAAEDLSVTLVGDEIETGEFVVEQVLLNLPIRALCREDCQGLCPTCGDNRNESKCSCPVSIDPRWGALAGLKSPG
jgi:uncharacterized protein